MIEYPFFQPIESPVTYGMTVGVTSSSSASGASAFASNNSSHTSGYGQTSSYADGASSGAVTTQGGGVSISTYSTAYSFTGTFNGTSMGVEIVGGHSSVSVPISVTLNNGSTSQSSESVSRSGVSGTTRDSAGITTSWATYVTSIYTWSSSYTYESASQASGLNSAFQSTLGPFVKGVVVTGSTFSSSTVTSGSSSGSTSATAATVPLYTTTAESFTLAIIATSSSTMQRWIASVGNSFSFSYADGDITAETSGSFTTTAESWHSGTSAAVTVDYDTTFQSTTTATAMTTSLVTTSRTRIAETLVSTVTISADYVQGFVVVPEDSDWVWLLSASSRTAAALIGDLGSSVSSQITVVPPDAATRDGVHVGVSATGAPLITFTLTSSAPDYRYTQGTETTHESTRWGLDFLPPTSTEETIYEISLSLSTIPGATSSQSFAGVSSRTESAYSTGRQTLGACGNGSTVLTWLSPDGAIAGTSESTVTAGNTYLSSSVSNYSTSGGKTTGSSTEHDEHAAGHTTTQIEAGNESYREGIAQWHQTSGSPTILVPHLAHTGAKAPVGNLGSANAGDHLSISLSIGPIPFDLTGQMSGSLAVPVAWTYSAEKSYTGADPAATVTPDRASTYWASFSRDSMSASEQFTTTSSMITGSGSATHTVSTTAVSERTASGVFSVAGAEPGRIVRSGDVFGGYPAASGSASWYANRGVFRFATFNTAGSSLETTVTVSMESRVARGNLIVAQELPALALNGFDYMAQVVSFDLHPVGTLEEITARVENL